MCEYTLLFADPNCVPRAMSFEADTPVQALTLAQRKSCAAHLFKEGAYVCTLECTGDFWVIRSDPVGARTAMVQPLAAATVARFLGDAPGVATPRPALRQPVGSDSDRSRGHAHRKSAAPRFELEPCAR